MKMKAESEIRKALKHLENVYEKSFRHNEHGNLTYAAEATQLDSGACAQDILERAFIIIETLKWVLDDSTALSHPDRFLDLVEGYW